MLIASQSPRQRRHDDTPTADGDHAPLRGCAILIVEDDPIVARDLALTAVDEGAAVRGPVHRLGEALALADLAGLDAALLDVDLDGHEVFAFADLLRERGVPIVFHTGRSDLARLLADYPGAPIVRKPGAPSQIVRAIMRALAGPADAPPAAPRLSGR